MDLLAPRSSGGLNVCDGIPGRGDYGPVCRDRAAMASLKPGSQVLEDFPRPFAIGHRTCGHGSTRGRCEVGV